MPNDDPTFGLKWTIIKTLEWTANYFKQLGIAQSRSVAEILLANVLCCARIDLYLKHDQPLNAQELANYKKVIRRRAKYEPEAYIIGQKEFWSLNFEVSPDVLIPRPETECLVETVLSRIPADDAARVLELGVGSGAISVALAHERTGWQYWASDISFRAIRVARKNAVRLLGGNGIRFFVGRWFEPLDGGHARFDLVLSNPPYIPTNQLAQLQPEIQFFEPPGALDGGPDGLVSIARIIDSAHVFLKPGGYLLLEMGHDQMAGIKALVRRQAAYDRVDFRNDYSGYPRVALVRKGMV
jgi:release factor glutamine methyltransferase